MYSLCLGLPGRYILWGYPSMPQTIRLDTRVLEITRGCILWGYTGIYRSMLLTIRLDTRAPESTRGLYTLGVRGGTRRYLGVYTLGVTGAPVYDLGVSRGMYAGSTPAVNSLRVPRCLPEYDTNKQNWYPGTLEYAPYYYNNKHTLGQT